MKRPVLGRTEAAGKEVLFVKMGKIRAKSLKRMKATEVVRVGLETERALDEVSLAIV